MSDRGEDVEHAMAAGVQPSPAAFVAGVCCPGGFCRFAGRCCGRGFAPPCAPAREAARGYTLIASGTGIGGRSKFETGSPIFTYVTAVTSIKGDRRLWETHQPFQDAMQG